MSHASARVARRSMGVCNARVVCMGPFEVCVGSRAHGFLVSRPVLLRLCSLTIGPPSRVTVLNFGFGGSSMCGLNNGCFSARGTRTTSQGGA